MYNEHDCFTRCPNLVESDKSQGTVFFYFLVQCSLGLRRNGLGREWKVQIWHYGTHDILTYNGHKLFLKSSLDTCFKFGYNSVFQERAKIYISIQSAAEKVALWVFPSISHNIKFYRLIYVFLTYVFLPNKIWLNSMTELFAWSPSGFRTFKNMCWNPTVIRK